MLIQLRQSINDSETCIIYFSKTAVRSESFFSYFNISSIVCRRRFNRSKMFRLLYSLCDINLPRTGTPGGYSGILVTGMCE